MKKSTTFRWIFYAGGLLILAMGIILNTKSGLGVSPIISVAYSISTIWNLNFGNTTFGLYTVFVIIELLLHTRHNYRQRREENHALDASTKKSLPLILGMDLLQLPLSLVFTRFMNLFSSWIPAPEQVGMRSVFRPAEYVRRDGASGSCPDPCHYTDRDRRGHVAEHADCSESGRRNRTGNRRYDPKTGWIYKKLL